MKKLLAALLVLLLVAGCGSGSSTPTPAPGGDGEKTDEVIEIEFWLAQGNNVMDLVNEEIDNFNKSQTKYHVTAIQQENYVKTFSNLQAAIAGKNAPDVVLLDTAPARQLYEKGALVPFDGFQANDPDFNDDDFYAVYADQGKHTDGATFARPWYGTIQIAYYSVKAFEDAGVDPESIKSWQDLVAVAPKFQEAGYQFAWEPMGGDGKNLIDAAFANGAKVLSDDGKTVLINSPEWVEVWESFRGWIHENGYMQTHWNGIDDWVYWYDTIDDVIEGRSAGYTGSPVDSVDFDFDVIRPLEQFGWEGNVSMPWAQALMLCMPAGNTEAEQQGAYEFIKFLTNPENQAAYTMLTTYPAANKRVTEVPEYQKFLEENPVARVLLAQSEHASIYPVDPTGGRILNELNIAAEKIEIEGISAQEALDEACTNAQIALDEALAQ
ncbi:MAG: extracellular solute-binding protein [Erysipelotrichaceae bacterium]|nr:extracellular solute-binding protein [Erysipelotrichaceae bacterium]MBR2552489.1 extracellular solute-binding protein [Erysipelotrichaceae bacterium]MBR4122362.1 extracellular solute-binding protein [Erysipelotrichaceae bacterium]